MGNLKVKPHDMDLSKFSRLSRYQKLSLFLMEAATDDLRVQQRGVALVADFRELNFQRFRSAVGLEDHFCCRFFLWPRSLCEIRYVICLNSKIGHAMDIWYLMTDRICYINDELQKNHEGHQTWPNVVGLAPFLAVCGAFGFWLHQQLWDGWLVPSRSFYHPRPGIRELVMMKLKYHQAQSFPIEHEGGVEICSNIRALVSRILNSADWSQKRCCHRWHLLDARWGIGFAWRRRWRTSLRTLAFVTWTAIQRLKKGNEKDLFLCLTYLHMFMIYIYI